MTKVDAIFSQVMELTPEEQQELRDRMDHLDDDAEQVDRAIMEEIYRRADEMKSGAVKGVPVEEVLRRAHAAVDAERRKA